MAVEASLGPGIHVGPTGESGLFFHVRPGHGEALPALLDSAGYRPGEYDLPIAVIHDARIQPEILPWNLLGRRNDALEVTYADVRSPHPAPLNHHRS